MENHYFEEIEKHLYSEVNFNDLVLNSQIEDKLRNSLNALKQKREVTANEYRLIQIQHKTKVALEKLIQLVNMGFEFEKQEQSKLRNITKQKTRFIKSAKVIYNVINAPVLKEHISETSEGDFLKVIETYNQEANSYLESFNLYLGAIKFLHFVRAKGEIKTEEDFVSVIMFYLNRADEILIQKNKEVNSDSEFRTTRWLTEEQTTFLNLYIFYLHFNLKLHDYVKSLPKSWGVSVDSIRKNKQLKIIQPCMSIDREIGQGLIDIFKRHTDSKQLELVIDFFEGRIVKTPIVFKGKPQQLYDVFRKLYKNQHTDMPAVEIGLVVSNSFKVITSRNKAGVLNANTVTTFIKRDSLKYNGGLVDISFLLERVVD